MNIKDLIRLGVPEGPALKLGMGFIVKFISQGGDPSRLEEEITAIVSNPEAFLGDPEREAFARSLYEPAFKQREKLAPWRQWGSGLEPDAVKQMANACALPVAVAGALMPDAEGNLGFRN
jgi:tRNA-splicing ligase RtcB (3'-phosphate/5'-hydroxy nucleic acid ligase)